MEIIRSEQDNVEFLERMKITPKKSREKADFRRIAELTFSGNNEKSFEEARNHEVCVWICFVCGDEFECTKDNVIYNGVGHCNSKIFKAPARPKLSIDGINQRAHASLLNPEIVINCGQLIVGKKYDFRCIDCNHVFSSDYGNVKKGGWCPYCASTAGKLCGDLSCKLCLERSMIPIMNLAKNDQIVWCAENKLEPHEVSRSSEKTIQVSCRTCGHNNIPVIAGNLQRSGCAYCAHKKLCDDDDCEFCFQHSAAIHTLRADITITSHSKAELRQLARCSTREKVTCRCVDNSDHMWCAELSHLSRGSGCPHCKHKTETLIYDELQKNYNANELQKEKSFEWCKHVKRLRFDFVLCQLKIIIECDGVQHRIFVAKFKYPLEFIQERDAFKEKCALENGYSIIRLKQERVYKSNLSQKKIWVKFLTNAIEKVVEERVKTGKPVNFGYAY